MNAELLKSICVRVKVYQDDKLFSVGSGFIISHNESYFVITAEHCILGSDTRIASIDTKFIQVEYKFNNDNEFGSIKVISVVAYEAEDIAILGIEKPDIEFDFGCIQLVKSIPTFERYFFRGFPKRYNNNHREYECRHIDTGEKSFSVSLTNDTFADTLGTDGADNAKGLSGSGLFIVKEKVIYLAGILSEVVGRAALHDDIVCRKIDFISSYLKIPQIELLDNITVLDKWIGDVQTEVSDNDVKQWMEERIKEVENLIRKNNVLYSPEKATLITHECIVEFLVTEKKVDNLRKTNPDLVKKFNESANTFEKNVKRIYSKDVDNRKEALEILEKVKAEFSKNLKEIFMDKGDIISNELGLYKITEWLQNCSLDFKG